MKYGETRSMCTDYHTLDNGATLEGDISPTSCNLAFVCFLTAIFLTCDGNIPEQNYGKSHAGRGTTGQAINDVRVPTTCPYWAH
jgi:hypothetical protein